MEIWFDMDGTLAGLYQVDNWLPKILARDTSPYTEAKPLLNLSVLTRRLNQLIRKGFTVNVISWTSKGGSDDYNKAVKEAKFDWLRTHLKSVHFSNIDIVAYGTPKQVGRNGILFDDEEQNRNNWNGKAYDADKIMEIIGSLCHA